MGQIFNIFPNLSQNWLKFKTILEKVGQFCSKFGPKNWADWYMNGSLFLEELVFVWSIFIPTKTKLEYPPSPGNEILWALLYKTQEQIYMVSEPMRMI